MKLDGNWEFCLVPRITELKILDLEGTIGDCFSLWVGNVLTLVVPKLCAEPQ